MRAVEASEYGGINALDIVERDIPDPREGQIRVEVRAAGINFADILQRRGAYPGGPTPPFIVGMEIAGVVDAVGEGVDYSIGDRVAGLLNKGGYAEYAIAHSSVLFEIPDSMSFEEAAGFPVQYLTAHNCLHDRGELQENERVLIHAAGGGVGGAAVQLARESGAKVFGTASTREKLEMAERLGCDYPINYTGEDFVDRVNAVTEGEGVDLILDGVGNGISERSVDALAPFGRMVSYGTASGEPGKPSTEKLLFDNARIIGFHLAQSLQQSPGRVLSAVPELTGMLADGRLEVQVEHIFNFKEVRSAHELMEDRKSKGKVVLLP
ncbi:quinone oxidoreductase family protein [Haladaptatus halobius]|uniref:quinone oxidoreductase family protein n=1 Tax=Haladaptatus halobius TaxID=2884875 RepID=UPI001D0A2571|nr:NADPH:quinone oxidoreductase family protein [Haladaptatus halobius]